MAALPTILFCFEYLLSKKSRFSGIPFVAAILFYLTAHNLTVLMTIPFVAVWIALRLWNNKKSIKRVMLHGILGVGLSAFYVIPLIFERNLVHIETLTQGYFNYINHFLSLKQLVFSTHWGYGPSELGADDDVLLGLGPIHLIATLLGGLAILKSKQKSLWIVTFFFVFLSLFLSHPKSTFIWDALPFMSILQFPWRYMLLASLCSSLLGGFFIHTLKNKMQLIASSILILCITTIYGSYFQPKDWYDITDSEKLSGESLQLATTASIYDYLPKTAQKAPGAQAPGRLFSDTADLTVLSSDKGTDWFIYTVVTDSRDKRVSIPVYTFPEWIVRVDDRIVETKPEGELGLVSFQLPFGEHEVYASLEKTWPRILGDWISVMSLVGVLLVVTRSILTRRTDTRSASTKKAQ